MHQSGCIPNENRGTLHIRTVASSIASTLIVIEHKVHSANEVCGSYTAVGLDLFLLNEKFHCDMSTVQAWPLCDASLKSGCFDLNSKTLKGGKQTRDEDGNVPTDKAYTNIKELAKSG